MPDTLNLRHQGIITLGTRRAQRRIVLYRNMTAITGRGNLQHLADRLDPVGVAMPVDERPQDLSLRSSSAWAKKALASFNISLARRNSFTSRSNALMRSRSSLVTPSRRPVSTSCFFTQSCRVWGTQPIFGAIDSMAAHCDGYAMLLHHADGALADFGGILRGRFLSHKGSILSRLGASSKPGAIHKHASDSVKSRQNLPQIQGI